jgi:hypothetical protein
VHNSTFLVTHEEASTGGDSRELVHEVVEEDFLEGVATQFGQSVYLGYEVLVFEFGAGVQLDTIIKGLGDG